MKERSDTGQFLEKLLHDLCTIGYIKPQEIPNISLYMDQVTTFMEEQLEVCKRYDTDKILTKTMINNYAKNHLLPPPKNKKYNREHFIMLLFIYYFKSMLSINDIRSILNPLSEKYFGKTDGRNMHDIYKEIFKLEQEESKKVLKDLGKKYRVAQDTFSDFPEEDQKFLHAFSFICMLSYDVYFKKMVIEQIIDDLNDDAKN